MCTTPPRSGTSWQRGKRACAKLIAVFAAEGGHRLVIEQDDSLLERDRSVLYHGVRRAGVADSLTYEHLPARSEPLLWLADTAAWCGGPVEQLTVSC